MSSVWKELSVVRGAEEGFIISALFFSKMYCRVGQISSDLMACNVQKLTVPVIYVAVMRFML
jgi:hypothetical protein